MDVKKAQIRDSIEDRYMIMHLQPETNAAYPKQSYIYNKPRPFYYQYVDANRTMANIQLDTSDDNMPSSPILSKSRTSTEEYMTPTSFNNNTPHYTFIDPKLNVPKSPS